MVTSAADIQVVPPDNIPVPPYANTVFTFFGNPNDVSIIFMRVPLVTDEQVEKMIADGTETVSGQIVGSITLPRQIAIGLADFIKNAVQGVAP